MTKYAKKIRKSVGNIVVSAAALMPGGSLAQQDPPESLPEGLAGEIMNAQRCGSRARSEDGVLFCATNHASLKMLMGYVRDIEAKAGNSKMPENIAVVFPLAPGVSEIHTFETSKLKTLAEELEKMKVDRNYPVVFSTLLPSPMLAMGDNEKTSGIIMISPDLLDKMPPEAVAEAVKFHIEAIRKKQRPNDRYV